MSLSFAVAISVVSAAARSAPRSEPANNHDFRPRAKPRSALGGIVTEADPTILKEACKAVPALEQVIDSLATLAERDRRARSSRQASNARSGTLCSRRTRRRFAALAPLMVHSMSNSASMWQEPGAAGRMFVDLCARSKRQELLKEIEGAEIVYPP
jgi:hypothetical protein